MCLHTYQASHTSAPGLVLLCTGELADRVQHSKAFELCCTYHKCTQEGSRPTQCRSQLTAWLRFNWIRPPEFKPRHQAMCNISINDACLACPRSCVPYDSDFEVLAICTWPEMLFWDAEGQNSLDEIKVSHWRSVVDIHCSLSFRRHFNDCALIR